MRQRVTRSVRISLNYRSRKKRERHRGDEPNSGAVFRGLAEQEADFPQGLCEGVFGGHGGRRTGCAMWYFVPIGVTVKESSPRSRDSSEWWD